MLVTDLRNLCQPGGTVILRIRRRKNPRGNPRLCGRSGPVGVIICVRPDADYEVAKFDAAAVLRFLDRKQRSET